MPQVSSNRPYAIEVPPPPGRGALLSLAADRAGQGIPPAEGLAGHDMAARNDGVRVLKLIDPSMARVWARHHRDPTTLNEHNCGDLISSFRAQGQQEIPAIVREVENDLLRPYEIICGVRRHWAASWIRSHGTPDFQFLVEIRALTDEEAFLVADLDGRTRRDISDYERARDYARALEWYYGGNQQRMAERLKVSRSWLSRFLELAKLPDEVVGAFGTADVIGIAHGAILAPVLRSPRTRERILEAAATIKAEQAEIHARTGARIAPPAVLQRLVLASRKRSSTGDARQAKEHVIRAADGSIVVLGVKASRGGAATIRIPAPTRHGKSTLLTAVGDLLEWFGSPASEATDD